jgi:hypothetical protein
VSREVAAFYHCMAVLPTPRYGDIRDRAPGCFGRSGRFGDGNGQGTWRVMRLCCVTIEMQGEKEDSLAVNRWTLPRRRPRRFRARNFRAALMIIGLFAFVCCGVGAPVVRADEAANAAARELADKLAEQLNKKQKIEVEFRDLDGLMPSAQLTLAHVAFDTELSARGIHYAIGEQPDVVIRVNLSESQDARIWIAQFIKGGGNTPVFSSFPKPPGTTPIDATTLVRIQAKPIFQQNEPILDFAVVKREGEKPVEMLILGADNISLYELTKGQWQLSQMLQIPRRFPPPRDPRGRLLLRSDTGEFSAGVPGSMCEGKVHSGISMKCDPSMKRWSFLPADDVLEREELGQGRNFFRPIEQVTKDFSSHFETSLLDENAYFSATVFPGEGHEMEIESRLDGRIWLVPRESTPVALPFKWGSDFLTIDEGCGRGTAILATGSSDYASSDYLQVFEIKGGTATAASSKMDFSGPITALSEWFTGERVHVVAHSLKSGLYEAYEITFACDR